MGFWNVNLEAAQAQASQAGPWAKKWLQSMTESTMHLAEQASSKLTPALQTPFDDDSPPSTAELTEYAITPDFQEFVRSLTYSTFRDKQGEEHSSPARSSTAASSSAQQDGDSSAQTEQQRLTPWQEKHALLVVRTVQEVNELRFVLVPKRMTDSEFWQIYFTLAREHLPAKAFDRAAPTGPTEQRQAQASSKSASGLAAFDIQDRFQQLSVSAKQWGAQASASLQAATANSNPKAMIPQALWQKLNPGQQKSAAAQQTAADLHGLVDRSTARASEADAQLPLSTAPDVQDHELASDPDLEAYLRDMDSGATSAQKAPSSLHADKSTAAEADDPDEDLDDDFDKYMSELNDDGDEELTASNAASGEHKAAAASKKD